ncbi:MAG: IS110 family transposase, partial [Pirellulales bacterium]
MSMIPVCVGFDYHDDSIRVCVMNKAGKVLVNRSVANSVELVILAVSRFGAMAVCAVEACCGAADFAHELRRRTGWDVRQAHPGYVRRLKQSPDKSDHDDAQLLADLVRVEYLPEVWLAPTEVRELRRLVRYRQQLKRSRVELKLQIRALLREERVRPAARAWTKSWSEWLQETTALSAAARWILQEQLARLAELDARMKRINHKLEELTAEDPMIRALEQHSGVGKVTAVTLQAEIGSWRRFRSGKQLARYCGVTPCNASSGKRQADAGLVKSGNRELRAVLIEAAHRLAQHDPKWRAFRAALCQRKPHNVAMAAIANRWIRWLYHEMIRV